MVEESLQFAFDSFSFENSVLSLYLFLACLLESILERL